MLPRYRVTRWSRLRWTLTAVVFALLALDLLVHAYLLVTVVQALLVAGIVAASVLHLRARRRSG